VRQRQQLLAQHTRKTWQPSGEIAAQYCVDIIYAAVTISCLPSGCLARCRQPTDTDVKRPAQAGMNPCHGEKRFPTTVASPDNQDSIIGDMH
jgi:hypothetical protein